MSNYKNKKSLWIYFSRADENYGVGYVEKGNTEYIAEYVKDFVGADLFKVEPQVPYPKDYDACTEEAKRRIGKAPIKEAIPDISKYEVILFVLLWLWHYEARLWTACSLVQIPKSFFQT